MAENAVYLSSHEHAKPTIFELWAEESFMNTLHPAFRLLCDFTRSKLPVGRLRCLEMLFEWPDELFLAFNLVVQSTYLDWFGASFSEAFYGLKRVEKFRPNDPLSTKAKILSLCALVGVPYVSLKVKSLVDYIAFDVSRSRSESDMRIVNCYKLVNVVVKFFKLYHYVKYLSGTSSQHSVLLKIVGLQLAQRKELTPSWSEVFSLLRHDGNKLKFAGPLAFKVVSQLFELGAFSLQFINWWSSSDSEIAKFNRNPIPKPIGSIGTSGICPICESPWKIQVALSTSGIVYCYTCITKVLADTGKCPVTGLPFKMDDLIRLYSTRT